MIKHTQLRLHGEGEHPGDCWATSIECVLELPLGTLPRWDNGQSWSDAWYAVQAWLYHHRREMVSGVDHWQFPVLRVDGYHLISGLSPRYANDPTLRHAVVGLAGHVAHDPHPSRAGLLSSERWYIITPVPSDWTASDWYPIGLACPCGCTPAAGEVPA